METGAELQIGNAQSQITGLPPQVFKLLRYELSYRAGEPGEKVFLQPDGSVKRASWDGYKTLLTARGLFPSGLVRRALRLLKKWQVPVTVFDRRVRPEDNDPRWDLPPEFQLRDYQQEAVKLAYVAGRGVIAAPPRSGKTIMIAELVRQVSRKTVITSPTVAIAQQTYEKLVSLFSAPEDLYLLIRGIPRGAKALTQAKRALVFVATAETALRMSDPWWDSIECLIVDERHHQAAKTYHEINQKCANAYFRWGVTGTNYRSDEGEQVALEAPLGSVIREFSIAEMIERNVLVRGKVEFLPLDFRGLKSVKYATAYAQGIVKCDWRNRLIAQAADRLRKDARKILILVDRIEHGEILRAMIPQSEFVQGKDGDDVRRAVARLDRGEVDCLIGSPVVGEGLDCPTADALIYAKGKMAKVAHTQDVFRVLTGAPGKRDARIIDFADRHNRNLIDHSVERMKNYLEMGISVGVAPIFPVDADQLVL